MAADEPPYLTVGTDVSAKYKGAFCEAKIKKVSRMVKCKVTFKNNQGSLMLTDDQIRGPLRIGAEIEARHPDKNQFLDAIINKMQDYSQYTVVFDDGDETTLRRTSLCLKSGRHFAESPTLDQFPLTNPEHFSTPVIGAVKTKRKRRSTMNSAALDYYSSDEELLPKKTKPGRSSRDKDPDVGKVVCVDYGDKRKRDSWYPGLIVTPDSSTQDSMKLNTKEEYFIRSFKDGKYYQVYKKDTREFNREVCRKVDGNLRAAVDKALLYQEKGELPPHWDKALYQSFEIPSPDEESQDTDTDSSDDEPSEEKDRFVAQLYKFMDERGTPINKAPTVGSRDLNLYKLFKVVHKMGGYNRVTNQNKWKIVYMKMGLPSSNISGSNQIKVAYKRYLHSFEDFYRKLGCTMVTNTRSTRGRHRSDRNIIITRNRDRDTASPKSNKSSSKEPKDKFVEKKPEEKLVENEKKDTSSKIKPEKVEPLIKSEDKMKKKVVEKPKSEEKDQKVKLKPKDEQKPRLVRSQSLNSKDKKDGNEDTKEQRTVRSRTREDMKKDKIESPEKKETRSSTKVEQENDKKDRDSPGKRSPSSSKDSKDRFTKEKKTEKVSSIEDKAIRKIETPPKEKKWEKIMREKVIKEEKSKSVICEDKCLKDKKEVLKKSEDGTDKKPKFTDTDGEKNNSNGKSLRDKKEKPKSELHVKRIKEENVIKLESDVKSPDTKLLKDETEVECLQETKIIKKEPVKEKKIDLQILDSELPDAKSTGVPVEQIQQGLVKVEDRDDVDSLTSQGERKHSSPEETEDNSKTNFMDSDDEDGSGDKNDFKEKVEIGDRVRVKYGRGRTQKVYEAKVLKAEVNSGEKRYYVHYAGWNMRYDEWVKRSFIVENISDRFRSGKQAKQPIVNKGTTAIATMMSSSSSINPVATITSATSVISSGFTTASPSVSGATSPATQKKEKIKCGVITSVKLSRKNSTSSTTSVSSSRTTRSDKNSLQSSPFSRGLLPKKRKRKKSGLSSSLTDMSQESESDEDQLSLLDPDEDDDDADPETDCTQSSRGPKDESFSDDDKDSLDYFERHKTSEEKSTSEEPLSCAKEEVRSEELSDDTLNGVEENSATEIPSSVKSSDEPVQEIPSVQTAFEKDNESKIRTSAEPVAELSDMNSLLKIAKDDIKPASLSKPIFDQTIPELQDSCENASKKDLSSTSSALQDIQVASSVEKTDITVGMLQKAPIISMNTNHPISKSSESMKQIAFESNVIAALGTDQSGSEVNTNRIKSVSELIETRYVEKKTEKIEPLNKETKKPKEVIEEKMPSLMSYMEAHDNRNAITSDVKEDKIQPKPSGSIEMSSSNTKDGKPKDPGCFSIFSSYMTTPNRIGSTASINEPFKSKSFSDDSNSASNLLMNFGMTAQNSVSPSKPAKMFSFLDEPPSTKPHFSSERLPFSSRMSSKLDVSVTKTTEPKSFKKYLKGEITKASLTPSPKLPEKDPFSIDLISDNENSDDGITDYSKSRSLIGSKALSETAGAKALCNLSCQKSLTYSECRSRKIQAEPYGFRVDIPETSTSSTLQQPKKSLIDFTFHKRAEVADSSPKTSSEANSTEKKALDVPQSESLLHETSVSRGVKDTCLPASVITFASASSSVEKHGCENPVEKAINTPVTEIKTTSTVSQPVHIDLSAKLSSIAQSFVPENSAGVHNINAILENKSDDARDISINIKSLDVKEEDSEDDIPEVPEELLIEENEDRDTKNVENVQISSKEDICNPITSKAESPCVKLDPDNLEKEVKDYFLNAEVDATKNIAQSNSQKNRDTSVIKKENEISDVSTHVMPYTVRESPPVAGNDNSTESDSCFEIPVVKKEVKKKKTKLSKLEKRLGCGESSRDESGKLKEGKGKSKKKKMENDEFSKLKDSDQRSKSKKVKKNKSKKHLSKYDDHNIEIFNKSDMIDENTKDVSEKIKRKEKRKREEKKQAKLDKSESSSEHKGEYSKKEKKKGRKNRISGDKKTELGEKKMKKKKKSHIEDMDSDSEKESPVRVSEKKKKKEKKKLKMKDCSSSDDAIDTSKAMREEDQDISFLLCEEKVPASPVNNVPEDTTGSSSMEDSSRSNRSPISAEERAPAVNLGIYSRSASIDVLNAMNKHNPEHNPCPVLDNTPPTTPSSTESIPSSSPSHDREEPFMHYTESTQSGRESAEGDGAESDGFNCESNRTLRESEEYRAAKTLAFAVCKSVSGKMTESSRTPVKRQKSENDEYTPSKKKKRSKRSCSYGGDSGRSGSQRAFSPRYSKGDNYDAFDSSGASPIAVRSPTHGGASSSLYASFSHAASQHMSLMSDGSSGMPSRSSKLNFFVPLHEYKDPEKRISILQDKMSELRKLYASLKAEVASIDRRKKKARKKGKESTASNTNNSSTYSEDLQDCS